jgi:hypothetical protein
MSFYKRAARRSEPRVFRFNGVPRFRGALFL